MGQNYLFDLEPEFPPPPMKAGRPDLRAPFPWAGGKSLWAAEINARLGTGPDIKTYAEPFAGSLAVLLSRPPAPREVVCDTDSQIVNAWRSIYLDPLATAAAADWPSFHDDLVARRRWLDCWVAENGQRMQDDPFFFDPVAAGVWVWVASNAIQGAVSTGPSERPFMQSGSGGRGVSAQKQEPGTHRPYLTNSVGGKGVQAHRIDRRIPNLTGAQGIQAQRKTGNGQRPYLMDKGTGGHGVQAQRKTDGGIPASPNSSKARGGRGVQAQRLAGRDPGGLPSSERWGPWFEMLSQRLKRVVVLNRSWEAALTSCATAGSASGVVAVLLDPPYVAGDRGAHYQADSDPESVNKVAADSHAWAVEHGSEHRIAYCHQLGSFEFPVGWHLRSRSYPGQNSDARKTRDAVAFSPACLNP